MSSASSRAISAEGGVEIGGTEVAELRHPGIDEERLEAEHPAVVQPRQLPEVAGDGAAPEADVNPARRGRRRLPAQRADAWSWAAGS